jgi:hypothetical protein
MDLMSPKIRNKVRAHLSDREWRLRNLYYIKDKEGNKVLFRPNAAQEKFLKDAHGSDIILKARQQGFTTLSCILFLDACLFTANLSAGIIAHNLEDANSFFTDKIKFAYDNLPSDLRALRKASTERAGELRFNNGSSIRVRTSFRSGTLQLLHISEFGKICAKSPDKAREIVTGALNAIQAGQTVVIESTAEGKVGYFFEYCEVARAHARMGRPYGVMDFKFHFFAWHESPEYQTDPEGVMVPQRLEEYFRELQDKYHIRLSPAQRAWYVKKEILMGDDMGREYPSHPDEAFAQAIEGAYYGPQIAQAEHDGRVGVLPYEPLLKVHTAWDLGMDDSTTIWFFQVDHFGARRYIDYYENSGEVISHYAGVLRSRPYVYGRTILPHDAAVRNLETGKTRTENLKELGFQDIVIVPNMPLHEGINAARNILPKCWFDSSKCHDGIEALKQYRKAWDDKAGCWKDRPLHDWTSHAADSFRMSALVDVQDIPMPTQRKASNRYR